MLEDNGVIEFLGEGGSGGEATVNVELRTKFPGLGGTIITHEGIATAFRQETAPTAQSGHRMFIRHAIIKKLEDYFYRKEKYRFAHIPRPLGSVSNCDNGTEAYLYEWVFGTDGFPWEVPDRDGNWNKVILRDWNHFYANFESVGVVMKDTTDVDNGRVSKNIVHQYPKVSVGGLEMNCLWKRIDFGYSSIFISFDKLKTFLFEKRDDLIDTLRSERYEMLRLAVQYIDEPRQMKEVDVGRLEAYLGEYRSSSLSHYTSRGSGLTGRAPVCIYPGAESLI
jgi:hypothetical protein